MIKAFILVTAIASPACGISMRCEFSNGIWPFVGQRYGCRVTQFKSPEISEVTRIDGNHTFGRHHLDVAAFWIRGTDFLSKLETFPTNLEKFFPNLEAIAIYDSKRIRSISSAHLQPWSNLTAFGLGGHKIEALDGDLFQYSRKLVYVDFGSNLIRNVGLSLLSDLDALKEAYFNDNNCTGKFATTPSQMDDLQAELIRECPPLEETATTTTSPPLTTENSCTPRCSINEQVDILRKEAEEQKVLAEEQADRIKTLESTVQKLVANPCVCPL